MNSAAKICRTERSRQVKGGSGTSSYSFKEPDKIMSGSQLSVLPPKANNAQTTQRPSSVSETELANRLLHEIAEIDRRPSGPLILYNLLSQPILPPTTTTANIIAAAHMTPAQSSPITTLTVTAPAHPVPHPHLYKVLDYAIYPFCPPPRRKQLAVNLAAQKQQAIALAAATAWVRGGVAVAQENNAIVVGSVLVGAEVNAAAINGATEPTPSATVMAAPLATKKKPNRNPRGPYKKHRRVEFIATIASSSTTATATTDGGENEGEGEPAAKKRKHGGGRSKGVVVCNLCGILFTRPFTLRRHVANMHKESVECVCGVRFEGEEEKGVHLDGGGCAGV
ncbi:uncharacterized protein LAJ45_03598 [Morchella importuna]|uniref:uncharacterized protein n=1 Tax=Morchella importuna TaxID=1174673 RepID=UPI001E8CF23B|nr:uncharacterized protein LAJ45_03598 [Morchella importuna]KAH8152172.1 hypothetical protein LAJ45_03598 [Morchella importuna]